MTKTTLTAIAFAMMALAGCKGVTPDQVATAAEPVAQAAAAAVPGGETVLSAVAAAGCTAQAAANVASAQAKIAGNPIAALDASKASVFAGNLCSW